LHYTPNGLPFVLPERPESPARAASTCFGMNILDATLSVNPEKTVLYSRKILVYIKLVSADV